MVPNEKTSEELHNTLKVLIGAQICSNIDSDIAKTEASILELIGDRRLSPIIAVLLIDCLLLLWRPKSAKAVIEYILSIKPGDEHLTRVASYIASEAPTKYDIIQASYCLKSSRYDELYHRELARSQYSIATLVRRNKIGNLRTILDLGCGTGLVGAVLKQTSFSGILVGVDLSQEMLLKAKENGGYNHIYCGSIHDYMAEIAPGSFDGAFFINLGALMDFDELTSLLNSLFNKVTCRGPIIFDLPNVKNYLPNRLTSTTVEPILKTMRIRFTTIDSDARRYYCCRR